MAKPKTVAVIGGVWARLREIMKRERAKSMNEAALKLIEKAANVQSSRFRVHKKLKIRYAQEEHEEITKDRH